VEQSSPLTSLEQFLKQSGSGFLSLQLSLESTEATSQRKKKSTKNGFPEQVQRRSIIVLDELPHLHSKEAVERFREALTTHVCQTAVPTVLIYSQTVEGKVKPGDLERLIEPAVLYSSAVRIVNVHPPTKARFGKAIKSVASKEGLGLSQEDVEALYVRTGGGDLRCALTTLQYEQAGQRSKLALVQDKKVSLRDARLSSFHALGKLLYAKRKTGAPNAHKDLFEERPPLEFDPERVVELSEMELPDVLSFLEGNCVEFFTDSIELSKAMDYFSDASFLLDRPSVEGAWTRRKNNVQVSQPFLASQVAGSLAGRAVADANRHPAPSKFRQFTSPPIYEVIRKRRENDSLFVQLHRRLSASQQGVGGVAVPSLSMAHTTSMRCASGQFAADVVPFVRQIADRTPEAALVQDVLNQMNSYFDNRKRMTDSRPNSTLPHAQSQEEELSSLWQEQESLLLQDDIVEDDSELEDFFLPKTAASGSPTSALGTGAPAS
jgi:cell cycle checkpoint protein